MQTSERMMIVGLCLQGLLANPLHQRPACTLDHDVDKFDQQQTERNVATALAYAQALEGATPDDSGQSIAAKAQHIAKIAWNAYRHATEAEPLLAWEQLEDGAREDISTAALGAMMGEQLGDDIPPALRALIKVVAEAY